MFFDKTIDLLNAGARLNLSDPLRNGNMLSLPGDGDLLVVGDLHNHQRNFERVQTFAALDRFPNRHVILQELIHGGLLGKSGEDLSLNMLLDAIAWAQEYPGQIHFLMANHDLAQLQGTPIMKDGYDLTDRFNRHLAARTGSNLAAAKNAFRSFVLSMPLGAVTASGIMLTHSLPSPRDMATFDPKILQRELTEADFAKTGSVYQLIWGRSQTQDVLNALSKAWWSDLFVCGHQAQDEGVGTLGDRMLILDSSHNHGRLLCFSLDRQYALQDLVNHTKLLAAIA